MPHFNYIVNKARSRTLEKNQNYMLVVVGATGSGKSYSALALAQLIDPDFEMSRVCFRAEEFLECAMKDLKAGSVIMFDEAGIDMSSREWYTTRNKVINQVVETFRRDNLICIWTTPVLKNIDKKSRSYFHGLGVMMDPDKTFWGAMKYFDLKPDIEEGGVLKFYPTVTDKHNRPISVDGGDPGKPNMSIPDPRELPNGKELVEQYEKRKKEFTEKIKKDGLAELQGYQDEEEDKIIKLDARDAIGLVAHNADEFDIHNEEMKDTELARRIYTRIQMKYPNVKVGKSTIRNIVGEVREKPEEAKSMTSDPLKQLDVDNDDKRDWKDEYLPLVMDLREKGHSLHDIADRLEVNFSKMYQEVRKAESRNN